MSISTSDEPKVRNSGTPTEEEKRQTEEVENLSEDRRGENPSGEDVRDPKLNEEAASDSAVVAIEPEDDPLKELEEPSSKNDGENTLQQPGSSKDTSKLSSLDTSRSSSQSLKRGRNPYVEIISLPYNTLRQYYHYPGVPMPRPRPRSNVASSSESDTSSQSTKRKRGRPPKKDVDDLASDDEDRTASERSSSDPIAREWASDEDLDAEDEDGMEGDGINGSGEIVYRRSKRFDGKRSATKPEKRNMRSTRANERGMGSRNIGKTHSGLTSRSSALSSFSEDSFRTTLPNRIPFKSGPSRRIEAIDLMSSSDFDDNEGEEEVDELEFSSEESSWDDRKKKSKGKGKRKKGKKEDSSDEMTAEAIVAQHRAFCEKCGRGPADQLLQKVLAKKAKGKGKPGRRKKEKDEFEASEEDIIRDLEGWLECDRCVVSWHWKCAGEHQRKDVLALLAKQEGPPKPGERKRQSVDIFESKTFQCRLCQNNPACMICHKDGIGKEHKQDDVDMDGKRDDGKEKEEEVEVIDVDGLEVPLKFRCMRCKQGAHYQHLPDPFPKDCDEYGSLADKAQHYQTRTDDGKEAWFCHQCRDWIWGVDIVIGWRPLPADAQENIEQDEIPNYKDDLPREYVIKFNDRGFRHVKWVPHAWLRATAYQKLKHFLTKGPSLDLITDETLAARGDDMASPTIAKIMKEEDAKADGRHGRHGGEAKEEIWRDAGPAPDKEAEKSLPVAWSTVDRVLDVCLIPPKKVVNKKKVGRPPRRVVSDSEDENDGEKHQLPDGLRPPDELMVDIDEWESRAGRQLDEDDVDEIAPIVTWCFVKWDDLQYDQSTWDTPPPKDSKLYPAFKSALKRYLRARNVTVPILSAAEAKIRDAQRLRDYDPPQTQPACIVGGTLMPFQLNGLQWLLTKHFKRESAILADDMGLGKTIQVASLLGYLGSDEHKIYPCLVVVPNSTITNWVREFEKWVPHMRVVPYYGEAASRKIISKYELYHKGSQNKAEGLKAHIVLTTYEMVVGNEFRVFNNIPRWEVVCVDEGQRMKSDQTLIWTNLKKLTSVHRLLLTGTPLNNNIRELFNLLNFLDPTNFTDRYELEIRYEQDKLNDTLVRELHEMVKPFILRRIKADVLRLPPKIEIIVPISLSALQKQVYKGVLEKNAEMLQAIVEARKKKVKAAEMKALGQKKPRPAVQENDAIEVS